MIYKGFHRILDTRTSSRWFGKFANARIYPPILRLLIRIYVFVYKIDLSEYEFDYKNVTTFNAFFTRKLKPGKRQWEDGICSPVDGTMLSGGPFEKGMLFQVKGMTFKLSELIGEPGFQQGSFVNLYLSPGDYHRIHTPFDLRVLEIKHIPGRLLSVSEKNANNIPNLYNGNERVVLKGTSESGSFYIVLVGALNVGSIGLTHVPNFSTNLPGRTQEKILSVDYSVGKGEEIGWFEMGSTVLIILEGNEFSDSIHTHNRKKMQLGNRIG